MNNTSSQRVSFEMAHRAMAPEWQGAEYVRRYGRESVSKPVI